MRSNARAVESHAPLVEAPTASPSLGRDRGDSRVPGRRQDDESGRAEFEDIAHARTSRRRRPGAPHRGGHRGHRFCSDPRELEDRGISFPEQRRPTGRSAPPAGAHRVPCRRARHGRESLAPAGRRSGGSACPGRGGDPPVRRGPTLGQSAEHDARASRARACAGARPHHRTHPRLVTRSADPFQGAMRCPGDATSVSGSATLEVSRRMAR